MMVLPDSGRSQPLARTLYVEMCVVYIICHSGSVEFDHAAIMQTHCMYLVDHLRLDLDKLVQYDVISCDERQLVEVEASSEARSYLLLKQLLVGRSSCEAESFD